MDDLSLLRTRRWLAGVLPAWVRNPIEFLHLVALRHRNGVTVGRGARLHGSPIVEVAAGSTISIGRAASLISSASATALGVAHPVVLRTLAPEARIRIGDDCGLSGTSVCAVVRVEFGDRVLVGADALVTDTDFHPIDILPRRYEQVPRAHPEDEVRIGDDVFIGARAVVLAGSTIGDGSVIGAGSVLKGEIPSGVVASGNPCRVVRSLGSAPTSKREPS